MLALAYVTVLSHRFEISKIELIVIVGLGFGGGRGGRGHSKELPCCYLGYHDPFIFIYMELKAKYTMAPKTELDG